jgi:hypothetical protein
MSGKPGAFVLGHGATDAAVFFIGHLMFGVVVGLIYGLIHSAGGLPAAW